jgi:hypothetical protein
MTTIEDNSERWNTAAEEESRPSSGARLLPHVTFGVGAAILAGVMVVSVPVTPPAAGAATQRAVTTAALGAAINVAGIHTALTTCCGPL